VGKTFDRYASISFFIIGMLFIVESRKISESAYGSNVGPDIFPMGLGGVLVLLSIRLFYEAVKNKSQEEVTPRPDYLKFLIILASAACYALFLEEIGYVFSTFAFLLISFQVIEKGKWLTSIAVSAGFSLAVYYLFVELLQGSLPGFPVWFTS
jgi:putative tricarboxylic transport membrane protein